MVTKLKNITFVFENCDAITIDGKHIGYFLIDDLQTSFSRVACNCIKKTEIANTFVVEIHKEANKERYMFDQTDVEVFKQMTFDRFIRYNDITSIQFELIEDLEDEESPCVEHYNFNVNWIGDDDMTNNAQISYISNEGHLYLAIAENKNIDDFFDINAINDSDYMDFHWGMIRE